ncbi:TetR/AcrR family transcriptional regulator [Cryobacterium sp. TMT3-29-2]|nr:TetR/AcrR family transcriptional regulator [Cryobacterium sp. TMT3-29-2]
MTIRRAMHGHSRSQECRAPSRPLLLACLSLVAERCALLSIRLRSVCGSPPPGCDRQRLSSTAWAEAAYSALAEGGLGAVAVEPLAVRIGATKGSFYSHFASRDELITAVVALWEKRTTDAVIVWLDSDTDPESRLRRLFSAVSEAAGRDPIEIHLRAASEHPLVEPVLRRVVQRRIAYTQIPTKPSRFMVVATVLREMISPSARRSARILGASSLYSGVKSRRDLAIVNILSCEVSTRWGQGQCDVEVWTR